MSTLAMFFFFFFNDTATTEIYTLSLHDALPISERSLETEWLAVIHYELGRAELARGHPAAAVAHLRNAVRTDRKSTRLNSSHSQKSYAVFCLKKKKKRKYVTDTFADTHQTSSHH